MRVGRLVAAAAAAVVLLMLVVGLYALAPAARGQGQVRIVHNFHDDPPLEILGAADAEIGVSVRDVDPADVTREKLAGLSGAVVQEVRSDGPAAKAGVKAGDVITAFDGERVRGARQLERLVGETPAGRSVKMSVMRGGSKIDVDIAPRESRLAGALGDRLDRLNRFDIERGDRLPRAVIPRVNPDLERRDWHGIGPDFRAFDFNMDDGPFAYITGRGRLGVQAEPVADQLAKYFGVESGVLVRSVSEDSPAAKAGLKAGDVITAVDGRAVKDPEGLRRAVADVADAGSGKEVTMSVTRDKKPMSIKVTLESADRQSQRRTRRTL